MPYFVAPNFRFLPMETLGSSSDGFLLPLWETWIEFLAPSVGPGTVLADVDI